MEQRNTQDVMAEEWTVAHTAKALDFNFILWPESVDWRLEDATEKWKSSILSMFGKDSFDEIRVLENGDMWDIVVALGASPNRSHAKKNWKKTDKMPDPGLSSFIIGRRNLAATVWLPPDGLDMRFDLEENDE